MIKNILIILLISLPSAVFSNDIQINQEYLLNSRSGLRFWEDSFVIEFGYGGIIRGTYRIDNNIVIITPKEVNHNKLGHLLNKDVHFKVVKVENNIYTDMFVCTDNYKNINLIGSYINNSTKLPQGSLLVINPDIEFIVLDEYPAITTDVVNVRDYPDINANRYIIKYIDDKMKSINCLAKGQSLYVVGRTKNTVKVNNWNNYWYMVKIVFSEYDQIYLENKSEKPKTQYYWIYGEFIDKTK